MAAPNVPQDSYRRIAANISGHLWYDTLCVFRGSSVSGVEAHCWQSSPSGRCAGGRTILVDGIDAIDVTAIGEELFDLGHSPYATKVSILTTLLEHTQITSSIRLPVEISGMPSG